MNKFIQLLFVVCVFSFTFTTNATVTALNVSPSNKLIIKSQDSSINLRWQIATDVNHSSGISSANARIINPITGAVLSLPGGLLSDSGSGPFSFKETIILPARDTDLWFNQGLKSVILKRTFADPAGGAGKDVYMTIQLGNSSLSAVRESTAGELNILGLTFEFANGKVLTQVDQHSGLEGTLTLNYTGTGLLEGRWQIAEPTGSYDEPLFRTLAVVRKNISANQRTSLKSPTLPTSNTGKYLIQFCVTNRHLQKEDNSTTSLCSNENLVVTAAYQVRGVSTKIKHIGSIQPNQQTVGKSTLFSWNALPETTAYQLQIFELVPTKANLASSQDNTDTVQPEFVIGMMLHGSTSKTALSELVLSKLQTGKEYLWRVSAHNQLGLILGLSQEATFIYE